MIKKIKISITRQDIFTSILFALLLMPNFFVLVYATDIKSGIGAQMGYLILSILVWLFLFVALPKKVFFGLGFLFLLVSPLEIIFVKTLGSPITVGFLDSVFKTNFHESKEQITSHTGFFVFYVFVLAVYIFLFLKVRNGYLPKKWRVFILVSFFLFNGALFFKMFTIQKGAQDTFGTKLGKAWETTLSKYEKIYPANLVINGFKVVQHRNKATELNKNLAAFSFHAVSKSKATTPEIYVLVIGETSRYGNYHINGYARKTTPNLDTLERLLSFKNMYATANLTALSVPQIVTRADPFDIERRYREKTILDAFKEAGYHTAWFASQSGEHALIKRLEHTADLFSVNHTEITSSGFYDEAILPEFNAFISKEGPKKFIVVHTLGSHFRYSNRYPDSFRKYTPEMGDAGYSDLSFSHKDELVNSYDNSILYTDYFLHLLIQSLKSTHSKAALLYVSDHGENLYDDENRLVLHGAERPTKYEYHIPYFIWYSKEYQETDSSKVNNLKYHLSAPASSTSTFYTLLDMANIVYKGAAEGVKKSLASSAYEKLQKRYMLNSAGKIIEIE